MLVSSKNTSKKMLENISFFAAQDKEGKLLFTASIILSFMYAGADNFSREKDRVRKHLISLGYKRMDRGTIQPSRKANDMLKAAISAVNNYYFNGREVLPQTIKGHTDEKAQTRAIAKWLKKFALSNDYHEGYIYLYPLTANISKAEARKRIKEAQARTTPTGETVQSVKPSANASTSPAKPSTMQPNGARAVTRQGYASGLVASLIDMLKISKGEKPSVKDSVAVTSAFNDIDAALRLVRGETVTSASKEAKRLSVALAQYASVAMSEAEKPAEAIKRTTPKGAVKKAA